MDRQELINSIDKLLQDLESFKALLLAPQISWLQFGSEKYTDIKRFLLTARKRVYHLSQAVKISRAYKGSGWLD